MYLIFELDGMTRQTFVNETLAPKGEFRKAWVSAAQTEYLSISAHANSEMFVVQFRPGGAARLLNGDISEYSNQVIDAAVLLGDDVLGLRQQLLDAADQAARFAAVTAYLTEHCRPADTIDTVVADLVQAIQENSTAKLKDLIRDAGYSQKQLIHHFKQRVGLTPKSYQRIVRFNELLPKIMAKQTVAWNTISVECDYFDQSHFIKEFRTFCGYSPKQFLVEQKDHGGANFFPLNEEDA
jgi:AraC-like DNA-binding protein